MKKLCQYLDGKCSQCGKPMQPNWNRPCGNKRALAMVAPQRSVAPTNPEGLGDWTERMLKKIGVTEDRWGQAKAMMGLEADDNCTGCARRKAWLNKVSAWWRGES